MAEFLASCPENSFQKVPSGYQPFMLGQRAGATVRNGAKLFAVGFLASLLGVGATNSLVLLREALDPDFIAQNAPQVSSPAQAFVWVVVSKVAGD